MTSFQLNLLLYWLDLLSKYQRGLLSPLYFAVSWLPWGTYLHSAQSLCFLSFYICLHLPSTSHFSTSLADCLSVAVGRELWRMQRQNPMVGPLRKVSVIDWLAGTWNSWWLVNLFGLKSIHVLFLETCMPFLTCRKNPSVSISTIEDFLDHSRLSKCSLLFCTPVVIFAEMMLLMKFLELTWTWWLWSFAGLFCH